MSGYHKSIEVYKFLRKNGVPVIVPIRNLYVSGTHMDVAYIDHNVTITEFTSSSLELYDYTELTVDVPTEHQFNIIDVELDSLLTFVNYTSAETSVPTEHQFNILDVELESSLTFTEFGNVTVDVPTEHQFNILDVELENQMTMVNNTHTKKAVTDHMLTISDFTSTSLVIS